jgi:hypothetical protein
MKVNSQQNLDYVFGYEKVDLSKVEMFLTIICMQAVIETCE